MKLSIVIPAHNEEQRLPPVLRRYSSHFAKTIGEDGFELLVVVNGSDDRTAEVARGIAAEYSGINVIEEPRRIGKGGAIIMGVKEAKGDRIGFVDADGATSAEEFERLYHCGEQRDGVIGSRWMKGAQVNVPQKGLRLLSSRLFNLLIRKVLGLSFEDTQCGAKIFTAKAWKSILPQIGVTRFAFDVDVLFQLKRHGFHVLEEPTVWNDVEGSKVRIVNSSFDMLCAVFRMRLLYSPLSFFVVWYEKSLSRMVEFFLRDDLFRHASLLFFASMLTAFGNMGFQMIVGRALPQGEYALLASFLALFAIISRPLATLSTVMTHYTSLLLKNNDNAVVEGLLQKWVLRAGGGSVLLAITCILFASQIARFFHLDRMAPVVVLALAFPAIFVGPVLDGAAIGMQKFALGSLARIANAAGRVLFGALFVWLLFSTCGWALAGHVAGLYVSLVIFLAALLPWMLRYKLTGVKLPSFRLYVFQCFFVQVSTAILMNGDVVMVKHYLPADMEFAYAATLGRIVAFMAVSVAVAMFPKVASKGEFTYEHRRLYLRSMLYTSGFVGLSLVLCIFFPSFFLRLLFGISEPSNTLLLLTRWMSIAMAGAALLNINVSLLLAQRRFKHIIAVVLCAIFYLVAVYFHHPSALVVVFFSGLGNLTALIATTAIVLSGHKTSKGNES